MLRIKNLVFFLLCIFFTSSIVGQNYTNPLEYSNVPSPEASSLGRYTDVPVSYSTGVPNIQIPIYDLSLSWINFPITLSYHGGGMLVNQVASNVGLGWSLNAGGRISRTVQGVPDEFGGGYLSEGSTLKIDSITLKIDDNTLQNLTNSNPYVNTLDSEPDIFSFNFNGYSGKFYLHPNGIDVVQIPKQELDIEYTKTTSGLIAFTITTNNGNKYIFGALEGEGFADTKTETSQAIDIGAHEEYVTGWFLRKVVTPYSNREINFSYKRETYSYKSPGSKIKEYKRTYAQETISAPGIGGSIFGISLDALVSSGGTSTSGLNYSNTIIRGWRLTGISSNNSNISFSYNNIRDDTEALYSTQGAYELNHIKIEEGTFCKTFDLSHKYTYDNLYGDMKPEDYRLILDKITEKSCADLSGNIMELPPYSFDYEISTTNYLPSRMSKAIDHWGYYNGLHRNNSNDVNVPPTQFDAGFDENNPLLLSYGESNRDTDPKKVKLGSLKKITYPTGGYTEFDFESNQYYGNQEQCFKETILNYNQYFCEELGNNTFDSNLFTIPNGEDLDEYFLIFEILDECENNDGPGPVPLDGGGLTAEHIPIWKLYNVTNNTMECDVYLFNNRPITYSMPCLQTGKQYKIKSDVSNTTFRCSIQKKWCEKVLDNYFVGGARIKEIRQFDGSNTITKSYEYNRKDDNQKSSGEQVILPKYDVTLTGKGISENAPAFFMQTKLYDYSIHPLSSFEGQHIVYSCVKETINGAGYNLYEIYTEPTGEDFVPTEGVNFNNIPLVPRKAAINRGFVKSTNIFNESNTQIGSNSKVLLGELDEFKLYEFSDHLNVRVFKFNPIEQFTYQTSALGLYGSLFNWENYHFNQFDGHLYLYSTYDIRTKAQKISTEAATIDGVTTNTEYFYSDNEDILQPIKQRSTNSDGKIHETRYKYNDEYTDNDANTNDTNIKNWLQTNNIIEPWETSTYVYDNANDTSPTQVDGTRFTYNKFDTSGNSLTYYPKTFQRYERTWDDNGDITGGWENQHIINSYNTSVGKPTSITVDGWSDATTYSWTSTGNLNTKTYKDFITDYNYHPNTDLLSEIIEPDGQKTTFTYDDFLRLDVISSRGGKVKKDYNYSYQPNYIEEISTFNDTGTVNDITHTTKTTFDGLGRDIQIDQVGHKWNSPGVNITVLKEYNNRGLLEKVYEPDDDAIITAADKFTEYTYYPDPLGRVQTVKDPMGFVTESGFGTNTTEIEGFDANSLYKETVIDADGISTSSYTDKLGRTVATRTFKGTEATVTYTNYDDKSRVSSIIPPGATPNDAGLIYQYTYDGADNVLTTKFPDKGLMQYQYDARNLQIGMQDANIKAEGKGWLSSLYDEYGRLSVQGFDDDPENISESNDINEILIKNFYDQIDNDNPVNIDRIYKGKLHKSEVNILNGFNKGNDYLTTSYNLDAYGRVNKETTNTNHIGLLETVDYTYDMADNILTNKHKVGGTTATESFQFDSKGRLATNNFMLSGKGTKTIANYANYSLKDELLSKNIGAKTGGYLQKADYAYNANGWLKSINGEVKDVTGSKDNCTAINGITSGDLFALTIKYADAVLPNHIDRKNGNISEIYWQVKDRAKNAYRFNYDYLNRLTEAKHYVNASYKGEYDANYAYDERGNIMALSRNGLVDEGANCTAKKQQIDNLTYLYEEGTNKLAMVFDCAGIYSGQHVNPISNNAYVNKYITSDAKTNTPGGTNNTGNINFVAGTYITLKGGFEYNTKTNGEFHATINDAACPSNSNLSNYGFKGTESSYRYDANGNLTYDSQKELGIAYNHLNLPYKAEKDANNKIEWLYTADGRKLQKKVTENGTAKTKNYLGNMEFTQNANGINTLEAAYHSEGRVLNNGTWEYNLKDHLGNVRIVFKENNGNAQIVQENHYYPFGMQQNGNWSKTQTVKNDYLYNGKELNTEIGLNWSDYGARFYDSAVGRFTGVDPLAGLYSFQSTYVYAANNPISFIDWMGMGPTKYENENTTVEYKLLDDDKNLHQTIWTKTSTTGTTERVGSHIATNEGTTTTEKVTSVVDSKGEIVSSTLEKTTKEFKIVVTSSGDVSRSSTILDKEVDNNYDLSDNIQAKAFTENVSNQIRADPEWNPWNDNVSMGALTGIAIFDGVLNALSRGNTGAGDVIGKRNYGRTAAAGLVLLGKNVYRKNANHSGRKITYNVGNDGSVNK